MGGKRARKSSWVVTCFTFLIPKRTVFLSEVITPKTGKGHFCMAMGIFNSQLYLLKKVYSAERTMKTNASHTLRSWSEKKWYYKKWWHKLIRALFCTFQFPWQCYGTMVTSMHWAGFETGAMFWAGSFFHDMLFQRTQDANHTWYLSRTLQLLVV